MSDIAVRDTSQDLAVRTMGIEDAKEFVRNVKDTTFVKGNLRGKPFEILACVLAGRELGMEPMESLREIDVIDGRPSLSAKGMSALAMKRGHKIEGTIGQDSVTIVGTRGDNGATMTVKWTLEMAKRAGLLSKKTWQQYPEDMMWNRGVAQLCRMLFPDVLTSVKYTPDESASMPPAALEDLPAVEVSEGDAASSAAAVGSDDEVATTHPLPAPSEDVVDVDAEEDETFTAMARQAGFIDGAQGTLE